MNLWMRFVNAMDHREPATPLALFRILVGLILLWDLADIGLTGAMNCLWHPIESGGFQNPKGNWLWAKLGGTTESNIRLVYGSSLLCCVSMIMGVGSRITALIAIQLFSALVGLLPGSGGGHDRLITNALWILVLAPADSTLSLKQRLKSGRWISIDPVVAWPRYLAVYQLVLMYTCTGIQKLGAEWWPMGNYLAVYYAVLIPYWARIDWGELVGSFPLFTQIGSGITWFWESTWGLVLLHFYFRKTNTRTSKIRLLFNRIDIRRLYILIGIVMHTGVAITMNLGPFSAITMSYYVCCIHHDEWNKIWHRVTRLRLNQPASNLNTVPDAKSAT